MRIAPAAISLLLFLVLPGTGFGLQSEPGSAEDAQEQPLGPDRTEVEQLLQAATEVEAAPDDTRAAALVELYKNTLAAIDERSAELTEIKRLRKEADGATEAIQGMESQLAVEAESPPSDFSSVTREELEDAAVEAELEKDKKQREVARLEAKAVTSRDRRGNLPEQLAATTTAIDDLEERLVGGFDAAGDEDMRRAQQLNDEAQLALQLTVAERLRIEEATFETRRELSDARAKLAERELTLAQGREDAVKAALNKAIATEAEQKRQEALRTLEDAAMENQVFRAAADETLKLRDATVEFAAELDKDAARIRELKETKAELQRRFRATQRRINIDGLSAATGLRLRKEQRLFVDPRQARQQAVQERRRKTSIELAIFEHEQRIELLEGDESFIDDLVASADPTPKEEPQVRALAERLEREYLSALKAHVDLLSKRSKQQLNITEARTLLIAQRAEYQSFVLERILWIRSAKPIWTLSSSELKEEMKHFLSPSEWAATAGAVIRDLRRRPFTILLVLVGLLLVIGARIRASKALSEEGDLAQQRSQVSILPTVRATLLSLLIAAPYAAALLALGWFAGSAATAAEDESGVAFLRAFGEACGGAAAAAAIIGALRALTAKNGLEEAHFEAAPGAVQLTRRHTNWLLPVMPTAALVGEFIASASGAPQTDGLARLAFLVETGALLLFIWWVLSPSRGVLAINARASGPDDWVTRLRRLWFAMASVVTLSLMGLAVAGYGFTARNLFDHLEQTIGLILVLMAVRSIALRWIRLIRRREAFDKLRKKREEMRAKRLAEIERRRNAGESTEELESEGLEVASEEINVAALSSDLRSLIRMLTGVAAIGGAYLIWSSVLPALGGFDRVKLYQQTVASEVNGVMSFRPEWITLGDIGWALLMVLVTWRAVRDLPSLLEIILLRRLNMGSGERYAITTLLRYLLITIGIVTVSNAIGISWSKLQWLVAGVSVGLGFGLQEIFANFVSGITLLFERPVRVGDWVTLGDVEGVVSKIRIRATTIRDRDLKELIVPNREFITGRFINWTLSDPISRVTAQVGIAYGSDTERAIQLLLEAGRECSFSVDEPAPNVVFTSFGASSLDFELRVFVTGREIKPRVQHDLHMRIDAAFRAAEIEISFPQQDVHIRSAAGLEHD